MEKINPFGPLAGPPHIAKPAREYKTNEFTSVDGFGVGVLTAETYHERRDEQTPCGCCAGGNAGSSQAKKA